MQQKPKTSHWGIALGLLCLASLLSLLSIGLFFPGDNGHVGYQKAEAVIEKQKVKPTPQKKVVQAGEKFALSGLEQNWAFAKLDQSITSGAQYEYMKYYTQLIETGLVKYAAVPEVGSVKNAFSGKLYFSVYSSRYHQCGTPAKSVAEAQEQGKTLTEKIQVCFYAQDSEKETLNSAGRILYFQAKQGLRTLMVPMYRWSDETWFQALTIHELFHAMRLEQDPSLISLAKVSEAHIKEELRGFSVTQNILILSTLQSSKYGEKLTQKFVTDKSKTVEEFLETVTYEDLAGLDASFSPTHVTENSIRAAQYILGLALCWVDIKKGGKIEDRVKAYTYVSLVCSGG